jgi:tetratricopeptide (TPR) repeat protein
MLRQANTAKARLSWEEARTLYQRVAAGNHKSRDGYLGLAEIAFETKQTDQVIHYANKAGKTPRALLLLGHAYYKRGEFAKALEYYQLVIESNPDNKEAQRSATAARQRLAGQR